VLLAAVGVILAAGMWSRRGAKSARV